MICALRSLGIPAGYVSGVLRTSPPPGKPRLEGADAMHAWVLAWCGEEAGWVGLDPTNAILAGTDHVVLAVGRDYADVAPIDGVIFAAGSQRLEVSVQVAPVG
jgi:transglutaminase-like putative cysteine protease